MIDDFLQAVRRKHKDNPPQWINKIDRRIRRACLASMNPISMPSSKSAPPVARMVPAALPTLPPSIPGTGLSPTRTTANSGGTNQPSDITDAQDSLQAARTLVEQVIKATSAANDPVTSAGIFEAARSASHKLKLVCEDGCAEMNLTPLSERIGGLPLWVDPSTFRRIDHESAIVFPCLILALSRKVFRVPDSKLALFWEDKRTIAFNRSGQLFFNLRYFEEWAVRGRSPALQVLSFWYVTFAHELAHNVAKDHDREHEGVMETIIHMFMPEFMVLAVGTPTWEALCAQA